MRVKLTNMASQSTYYVYRAGLEYEVKITPDGQEAVRYYHYDQVGSTVAMTDSAQAITDRFHYVPWGYVLHSVGDSDTPFQFVGAYGIQTDPNGLINMRARYYNPVTKSFISADPSGFDGGLNWYLYASGNPLSRVDANGMWDDSVISAARTQLQDYAMGAAQSIMYNRTVAEQTWTSPVGLLARAIVPFVDSYANYSMGNSVSATSIAMDIASILPIGRVMGLAVKGVGTTSAVAKVASYSSRTLSSGITKGISTSTYAHIGAYPRKTVTVTSWAAPGITPELNSGRWVVKGNATRFNYFKTGLWGPRLDGFSFSRGVPFGKAPSITGQISADQLKWLSGVSIWRGLFGQRQIR